MKIKISFKTQTNTHLNRVAGASELCISANISSFLEQLNSEVMMTNAVRQDALYVAKTYLMVRFTKLIPDCAEQDLMMSETLVSSITN